ncbi:MAG: hypothetical protein JSR28_11660 [Proteobacteria bacterium]|nr:hypothetical protein [Pseudomonadota bacterium]
MSAGVDDSSARPVGGPTDPHAAWLRAGQARQQAKRAEQEQSAAASAAADPKRDYAKRYREEHREEIRAYRAKYHAENRDEVNRKNREYMRERSRRMRAQKERREKDRERVRRWTEANRERKRESIRRWREAHPEKTAEYSRRYYERNRDAVLARARQRRDESPEKVKAAARDWQQRNREHLSEWQRQHRAENPDAYARSLKSNRDAKRLTRRLTSLGLPAKRVRRVPAAERRAHEAESREFFERERAASARKRLMAEYVPMDRVALDAWSSRSPLARRRDAQLSRFRRQLGVGAGRVPAIREEVRMDAVARRLRGDRLDAAAELRQRVFDAAGGREYLASGGDRHTAALIVEESLEGLAKPVTRPDGGGLVWVPEHTRGGREIAGHWRRRPGG